MRAMGAAVQRDWLLEAELIDRLNAELAQYPACAGCRISSVRFVGIRHDDECNWVPDQLTTPAGTSSAYLSVLARTICDFQQRYSVAEGSGQRRQRK
jgi:hypothetical protein